MALDQPASPGQGLCFQKRAVPPKLPLFAEETCAPDMKAGGMPARRISLLTEKMRLSLPPQTPKSPVGDTCNGILKHSPQEARKDNEKEDRKPCAKTHFAEPAKPVRENTRSKSYDTYPHLHRNNACPRLPSTMSCERRRSISFLEPTIQRGRAHCATFSDSEDSVSDSDSEDEASLDSDSDQESTSWPVQDRTLTVSQPSDTCALSERNVQLLRRGSLVFAKSPSEVKVSRLQSGSHARRRMLMSPAFLSSTSSSVTNLFESQLLSSACGSDEMPSCSPLNSSEAALDEEPVHHRGFFRVCSPHLVKEPSAKHRSPSPMPLFPNAEESEVTEESENDSGYLDPCMVWASESVKEQGAAQDAADVRAVMDALMPVRHRRSSSGTRRRTILHSLMATEPDKCTALDLAHATETDERVLAAELLLMNKSPDTFDTDGLEPGSDNGSSDEDADTLLSSVCNAKYGHSPLRSLTFRRECRTPSYTKGNLLHTFAVHQRAQDGTMHRSPHDPSASRASN